MGVLCGTREPANDLSVRTFAVRYHQVWSGQHCIFQRVCGSSDWVAEKAHVGPPSGTALQQPFRDGPGRCGSNKAMLTFALLPPMCLPTLTASRPNLCVAKCGSGSVSSSAPCPIAACPLLLSMPMARPGCAEMTLELSVPLLPPQWALSGQSWRTGMASNCDFWRNAGALFAQRFLSVGAHILPGFLVICVQD